MECEVEDTTGGIKSSSTQTATAGISDVSTQTAEEQVNIRPRDRQRLSVNDFRDDPDGVHHFTGLENYGKFCLVLHTLGPAASELQYMYGPVPERVSTEDRFLLVLIKLCKHYTNFELSRLFGLSEADVYNIFCTWVRFMALQWRELPCWVSWDLTRFYAPSDFKRKFPETRVIVDGTECPIKKPKMPAAQQASFSTYKNRNTAKVLVGITPGGLCSYVSPAYGGTASDRQIVERSSMPQMCDPGDTVMADKGFDVQDLFAPSSIKVNIPTFSKRTK